MGFWTRVFGKRQPAHDAHAGDASSGNGFVESCAKCGKRWSPASSTDPTVCVYCAGEGSQRPSASHVSRGPDWFSRDFAIHLWVKPTATKHEAGWASVLFDMGSGVFFVADDALGFRFDNSRSVAVFLKVPCTLSAGQWQHLAVTRKRNVFTFYVDGTAIGSMQSSSATPDMDVKLTNDFKGQRMPFHTHLVALSAAEIANAADSTNPLTLRE